MSAVDCNGYRRTCYFCDQVWGACTCNFPHGHDGDLGDKVPGIDTGDFFITSPNTSECGRFYVDPSVYYAKWWPACAHLFPTPHHVTQLPVVRIPAALRERVFALLQEADEIGGFDDAESYALAMEAIGAEVPAPRSSRAWG